MQATPDGAPAPRSLQHALVAAVAVAYSLFHLWTSFFGLLPAFQQRATHLGFALCLAFLLTSTRGAARVVDNLVAAVCAGIGVWSVAGYAFFWEQGFGERTVDLVVGAMLTLAVLEGTRRTVGRTLPILSALCILYALFGNHLPEPLTHRGHDVERLLRVLYGSTEGIFGVALGASATVVAIFVIFAAILSVSGAGKIFIDLSMALFGHVRGGPAQIATASGALFGTVSGSAVANVVGSGVFTIPMMKRVGFTPRFAGAVEATSSTGGQLVPPVMGAAAFIMAEILSVPYSTICIAAIVPALFFYAALYLQIDSEAALQGIRGVPRAELPRLGAVLRVSWVVLAPIAVLMVAMIGLHYTEVLSAVLAIATLLLILALRRLRSRDAPGFRMLVQALEEGGRDVVGIALTCACAGIVISMLMLTGMATELATILVDLAGGHLMLLLLLTALASLVLGMGLPTTACYILLAVLVAPALTEFGVPALAAHMFIFYMGLMANVTPPVALAAYAGAGIAHADPIATGVTSFRLSLAGLLVPFFFVYRPAMLIHGATVVEVVSAMVIFAVAIVALVGAITGFLFVARIPPLARVLLGVGAASLIYPSVPTDLAGFGLVFAGALLSAQAHRVATRIAGPG